MAGIDAPQHRLVRSRRPAARYYASGAGVHAVVALLALALGYRWGAALLIPAFVLALLAVLARRRGTFIETVTSPSQPPVLYADRE